MQTYVGRSVGRDGVRDMVRGRPVFAEDEALKALDIQFQDLPPVFDPEPTGPFGAKAWESRPSPPRRRPSWMPSQMPSAKGLTSCLRTLSPCARPSADPNPEEKEEMQ